VESFFQFAIGAYLHAAWVSVFPPDPLAFVLLRHAEGAGGRCRCGGRRHGL
jgi:hypothetical protein